MQNPSDDAVSLSFASFGRLAGLSVSTLRRRMLDDTSFPKPFRFSPNGDLFVLREAAVAWIRAKADPAAQMPHSHTGRLDESAERGLKSAA